ncbi:RloB family protein [Plantibacter elymi (nom. nud.)]|uniref:RloB family protein n=1 Tax=Plantibacter elymi (nom. nud.) TaxID=199708 RepID=UPI0013FE2CA2|nr:RloB family protein [Plantibacter sp. VKM Ac-1784]
MTGGVKTEPEYLAHINTQVRSAGLAVQVAKSGKDPVRLVDEAIRRAHEEARQAKMAGDAANVFDEVWVMFDVDDFANSIPEALAHAENAGVRCAMSNPCFELWLLWHVRDSAGHLATKDAQQKAIAAGAATGHGGKAVGLSTIQGNYGAARARAEQARATHTAAGRVFPHDNPRSDVDLFIEYLIEAGKASRPDETIHL